jgi:hypothetical protein
MKLIPWRSEVLPQKIIVAHEVNSLYLVQRPKPKVCFLFTRHDTETFAEAVEGSSHPVS